MLVQCRLFRFLLIPINAIYAFLRKVVLPNLWLSKVFWTNIMSVHHVMNITLIVILSLLQIPKRFNTLIQVLLAGVGHNSSQVTKLTKLTSHVGGHEMINLLRCERAIKMWHFVHVKRILKGHFQVFVYNPANEVWDEKTNLKQGRHDALFFSVDEEHLLCS